jgi:hypothetical protein
MEVSYDKIFGARKRIQKFNPNREYLLNAVEAYIKKGGKIKKAENKIDGGFRQSYKSGNVNVFAEFN